MACRLPGRERIEVDLDPTTAAWLRQRCTARGTSSLAQAAAARLRTDALAEAATALAAWERRHDDELLVSLQDGETALGEVA